MTSVTKQSASLHDVVPQLHCMRFSLGAFVTGAVTVVGDAMWADKIFRLTCCDVESNTVRMLLVLGMPLHLALLLGCLATITRL